MKISEIWRYPVKSMQGERLQSVVVGDRGVRGDRVWAVRDEVKGGIRGAKKIPDLMKLRAAYPTPPESDEVVPAEITLSDGRLIRSDAADVSVALSGDLDREVTLWPLQPADQLEHYRRGAPDHEDLETELRQIFALQPDEGLPDLSGLPPEVMEYESPPGTYFDAFSILVMTEQSLARLRELLPEAKIDSRRFRPNIVIDTEDSGAGFAELAWVGKRLLLGDCQAADRERLPALRDDHAAL